MTDNDDDASVSLSVSTPGNSGALEKAEETTQLDERRIATDVGRGIVPPYNPETLGAFQELNETHVACVRMKARYEVGYGFDIVPHPQADDPDPDGADYDTIESFWRGSESRWQLGPEGTAASTPEEVLELARRDYHGIGWAALEILVEGDGTPVGLAHIPATTVRVRKTTTETEDGEEEIQSGHGYVQIRQGRRRYFGEAGDRYGGDKTFVDKETGDVADSAAALPNSPANELIFVPNPSSLSLYYGIPDWIAAMRTMAADEAAQEWNHDIFDNLGIPHYAIKVTGGKLTESSKEDLRELQENLKGEPYRTAILEVDEFEAQNPLETEDGSNVDIEFEPLGATDSNDMEFQAFRERNEHEIAKAHSVPPILINVTSTSNRANSKEQVREFAKGVIEPEQAKFEARLYHILHQTALDVDDWTINFELRGADQPSEDARVARTKIQAVRGALPVNRALEMIGEDPLPEDHPVDGETLLANVGNEVDPNAPGTQSSRPDDAPPKANKIGERPGVTVELDDPLSPDETRVDMMPFESSNLKAGLYDRQTKDLYIRFLGDPTDRIYVYLNVPEETWSELKQASSHGSYHAEHIKWDFVYEELTATTGWPQIGAAAPTADDD
ncbi:phage portal protein [Haloarcula amylovorans]|uniref:phage portal protein n=1 Tax=Haloarcula amylovorans TaxID=2562280 RepID=UPI001076674E|nr:phage portal protein [Halomicroarcula amylolytica]